MLKTPYRGIILCFIAILLPSYAYGMKLDLDASTKSFSRKKPAESLENSTLLDFNKNKDVIEKLPRSYKFIIAHYSGAGDLSHLENREYYGLQDESEFTKIDDEIEKKVNKLMNTSGLRDRKQIRKEDLSKIIFEEINKNKKKQAPVPTLQVLQELFNKHCEEYEKLSKVYQEARKTGKELIECKKKFEEKQIYFIRKFSSKKSNKALNKLIDAAKRNQNEIEGLGENFAKEIQVIETKIYNRGKVSKYILPKNNKNKSSKQPFFYVDPKDLKLEISNIKKLLRTFKREHEIQEMVSIIYLRDYIPFVTGMSNWPSWYSDDSRPKIEAAIESSVNKDYPCGPYWLNLIYPAVELDFTDPVNEKDLLVYLKNNDLYLKIKNKKEMKINKLKKTCLSGLGENFYDHITDALTNNKMLSSQYECRLLNFASLCGYLPDNPFTQATLRNIGKSRAILNILQSNFKGTEKKLAYNDVKKIKLFENEEDSKILKKYEALLQQEPSRPDFEYDTKDLEKHIDLCSELENFLPKHIRFQFSLDEEMKYNWVYSNTPGPFSAYQSNAYIKDEIPEILNLSSAKLDDTNFFYPTKNEVSFYYPPIDEVEVPKEKISDLIKYKKVILTNNRINGKKNPTFSPELKILNIRDNVLSSTQIVAGSKHLEILDASQNSITSLEGLSMCVSLTQLNLSENQLTKGEEICMLSKLTSLDISHNQFVDLRSLYCATLRNLTKIDVSHNQLKNISYFNGFMSLKELDISHNNVETLSPLRTLLNLKKIVANNNQLLGSVAKYFSVLICGDNADLAQNLLYLDVAHNAGLAFLPSKNPDEELIQDDYKKYFSNLLFLKISINNQEKEFSWEEKMTYKKKIKNWGHLKVI